MNNIISSADAAAVLLFDLAPPDIMATCPHCKGHLTDSHRCPRRPAIVATEVVISGLAGGFAGLLAAVAVNPGGQITITDVIAVAVGAGIVIGIDRYLRR